MGESSLGGFSYEGHMAGVYRRGRELLPEAAAEWRRALEPLVLPESLTKCHDLVQTKWLYATKRGERLRSLAVR